MFAFMVFLCLTVSGLAQDVAESVADTAEAIIEVAPVTSLIAVDHKWDDGEQINLSWVPSVDDVPEIGTVTGYLVYRIDNGGEPHQIADLPKSQNYFEDKNAELDSQYTYYVVTTSKKASSESNRTAQIAAEREWINFGLLSVFIWALVIGGAVIVYIETAKRGKDLFVRKIAGLEAVDDAIGRATEMGRPILFIPGIHDMDDVQTLAALTILGRVAEQVANYDTKISMPVARSLVMTAGRETIKAGYQTAGRPDAYNDDMVNYITDEQFGYVAAVDGIMVREKPATVFLLGAFFAESLILAETGNSVGAIQIAGTARPAQLPFFIAACDFTLIGEELFAASAYLSGEPKALGSLKGQDVGKAIAMVAILAGVTLATVAQMSGSPLMQSWLEGLKSLFTTVQ